jgi:hypothetical protein
MSVRPIGAVLAAALAVSLVPPASAHSVPRVWWLDEASALTSLRTALKPRYRWSSALRTLTGRCAGLAPRATRSGRAVYKHFSCTYQMRANAVNFTFMARVHVAGPQGRVTLGG